MFTRIMRLMVLTPVLMLCSCTYENPSTLRLGTSIWPGYEPLYLARDLGYLDKTKVHLVEYSSATQVIQAYRNEHIDAAALTLDEVLLLLERDEKPRIILVMDISNGGDAIIGQPDISTFSAIKGKRIGVEGSALGAYMFTRSLEIYGIQRNTVQIIQIHVDNHEQAFHQREIDAVVTFEPVRSKLLAAGGTLLFDSKQLPGEIVDVLIVREEFLTKNITVVQHLVNAWYQALATFELQPEKSAEILGLRMKLSANDTLAAYNGLKLPKQEENEHLLQSSPTPLLQITAGNMAKLMYQQQLLDKEVDVASLFLNGSLWQHRAQD